MGGQEFFGGARPLWSKPVVLNEEHPAPTPQEHWAMSGDIASPTDGR